MKTRALYSLILIVITVVIVATVVSCSSAVCSVTYHLSGGTGIAPDSDEVNCGDEITLPYDTFYRSGYRFVGWLFDGRLYQPGDKLVVNADADIYAMRDQDSAEDYTLTFGSGIDEQKKEINAEPDSVVLIPDVMFEYSDIEFEGWLCENELYFAGGLFTVPARDVTFVAQWAQDIEYTASFVSNEGEGSVEDITACQGDTITLPFNSFVSAGREFVGWQLEGNVYSQGEQFTMPDYNVTFTAVWQNITTLLDVYFYCEGELYDYRVVVYGSNVEIPETPYVEDLTFVCWTDSEGNPFDFTTEVTQSLNLYARLGFTVTFDIGEGVGETPSPVICYGSCVLETDNNFDRNLYRFAGWTDGNAIYNNGDVLQFDKNTCLTAVWERTHAVLSLYIDGVLWKKVVCALEEQCILPEDVPPEEGLTFYRWISATTGEPFEGVVLGDDMLYAEYRPFVGFDVGDGEGDAPEGFFTEVYTEFVLPDKTDSMHRDGYRFAGWMCDGVVYNAYDKVSVARNAVFVAVWEKTEQTY